VGEDGIGERKKKVRGGSERGGSGKWKAFTDTGEGKRYIQEKQVLHEYRKRGIGGRIGGLKKGEEEGRLVNEIPWRAPCVFFGERGDDNLDVWSVMQP